MLVSRKDHPTERSRFRNKVQKIFPVAKDKIPAADQVSNILGSFEDPLVSDWADTENDKLVKKDFKSFMTTFRARWLPRNWEQDVKTEMLGARLDPDKESFEAWTLRIQSLNTTLRGTTDYLDDDRFRVQLEILLDGELQRLVRKAAVSGLTELQDWIAAVKELDEERRLTNKRLATYLENSMRKRQNFGTRTPATTTVSTSTTTSTISVQDIRSYGHPGPGPPFGAPPIPPRDTYPGSPQPSQYPGRQGIMAPMGLPPGSNP